MNGFMVQISDDDIIRNYVSPNLYVYFRLKLPETSPDVLKARLTELLKFLILSHRFPGNILFGPEIDDVWHFWIMQTHQYEALCRALPGGKFVHHDSNDYPRLHVSWAEAESLSISMKSEKDARKSRAIGSPHGSEEFERNFQRMLSFFATYIRTFGPLQERHVEHWPPIGKLLRRMQWSIDDFNAFLASQSSIPNAEHPVERLNA